jgi:2-isopropylmalate synthase
VRYARHHTFDVQFSAEDATRSDFDFLCRVIEAVIKVGANTINLPDTVGYSTPDETHDFFRRIRERVTNADRVTFSAHCHDDLGLAVANTLAAVNGGARQVECTINGIGVPATPRSRKSRWRSTCAPIGCRTRSGSRPRTFSRRVRC